MIVVGGGIAGLSVAWRLVRQGRAVTVLDAARPGDGASHAAAGYLQPSVEPGPRAAFDWQSLRALPALVAEIEAETGMAVDFRRNGLLRVAYAGDEPDLREDSAARKAQGWAISLLDGEEARALEPALSPEITMAALLHDVTWVDGRKLCAALAEGVRRRGGTVCAGVRVTSLRHEGGRVVGLETSEGPMATDTVVLAAGWQADAIAGLPPEVPACAPLRGVILTLGMDAQAPLIGRIVRHPGALLCPRGDGRLLAGVTRDHGRRDPLPDAGAVRRILNGVCRMVPACADLPFIEAVCRFRPYLADEALLIGPASSLGGLHYALGYGANGYLLCAAGSAQVAAGILRPNDPDAAAALAGGALT